MKNLQIQMYTHMGYCSKLTVVIESFSDVVYLARIPVLLLDQGSKKSSSFSWLPDSSLDTEDACEQGNYNFMKRKETKRKKYTFYVTLIANFQSLSHITEDTNLR